MLFIQGLLNTFSVRLVALLNDVSVYWHLIGVALIFVMLFWAPSSGSGQSIGFLFGSEGWNAFAGLSGFSIPFYVFLIGLLNAQYTFTGYDASAHVSEETIAARTAAPKGIVNSIWISMIAGFILLLGVSYAIPHAFPVTIAGVEYTGYDSIALDLVPWATIFQFAAGRTVGLLLILIVIVAQFFCGMSSITANSRMIYAFSRDGAVPFSDFWHHVSKRAHVPVRSAWLGAVGAFILALPYLYNLTAYAAVTSIAVIGLYIAYLTPVFLRRINGKAFTPGPWVLGKFGPLIDWLAILWVVFIVILLMLPQYSPVTRLSFNYAPIAVIIVIGGAVSGTQSQPASGSRARRSRVPPKSSPRSSATSRSDRHLNQKRKRLTKGAAGTARRAFSCPELAAPHLLGEPREQIESALTDDKSAAAGQRRASRHGEALDT